MQPCIRCVILSPHICLRKAWIWDISRSCWGMRAAKQLKFIPI